MSEPERAKKNKIARRLLKVMAGRSDLIDGWIIRYSGDHDDMRKRINWLQENNNGK